MKKEKDFYALFLKFSAKLINQRAKHAHDAKQEQGTYNQGYREAIEELWTLMKKANDK